MNNPVIPTTDPLPPHSLEAEAAVLGCILQAPADCLAEAMGQFKAGPEVFYDARHRTIYETMIELAPTCPGFDLLILQQKLKDKDLLEAAGGLPYLAALPDQTPSAVQLGYYAEIVCEKHSRRQLVKSLIPFIADLYTNPAPVSHQAEAVGQAIASIQDNAKEANSPLAGPVDSARKLIALLDRRSALHAEGKRSGLITGFHELDKLTDGLQFGQQTIIAARPSQGKAQPLGAKILTPGGFVTMGELAVGSLVIGRDGRPHKVIGVYPQGPRPVFRVRFSDGTWTRCCNEHLWLTQSRNERKRGVFGSVKSLGEIRATLHIEHGARRNHFIPTVEPIDFGQRPSLPLHPWLLGALLGDGKLGGRMVCFFKPERDLQERVCQLLPDGDTGVPLPDGSGLRIKRKVKRNAPSDTRAAILQLGLAVNSPLKFIPQEYLLAGPLDRLELLRGLLDTDGYVNSGTAVEFSTSSERLAQDVKFLVRSLGGICTHATRIPRFAYRGKKKNGRPSHRINIWFEDVSVLPVTSQKHLSRWKALPSRHCHRAIIAVEPDGVEACQCIRVDSEEQLYLTDDFIVTHNTAIGLNIVEQICLKDNQPTLIITCEMSTEALMNRLLSGQANLPMNVLRHGDYTPGQREKMKAFALAHTKCPLYFYQAINGLDANDLAAQVRRMCRQYGIKFVLIDYLQKIKASGRYEKRTYEVGEVSGVIKSLAVETGAAILTLAQLNRESEKDKGRVPRLADLADSGQIERDADTVMLIYRDRQVNDGRDAKLIIAKQRDGDTGCVDLVFEGEFCRFRNPPLINKASYPLPKSAG